MTTPFIFITTHRVDSALRHELESLTREYTDFIHANEADMLAHYSYFDETRGEISLVQVHLDAASAERHMQLAASFIGKGLTLTKTIRVHVFGEPGPIVTQALRTNGEAGAEILVASQSGEGFTR
jgi:hypothetical protein